MFVPLLVASHNAVTVKITEVKKLKLVSKFSDAVYNILIKLNRSNYSHLCGVKIAIDQIEPHKQNNSLKIGKTWRIALMRVVFKKDDS